MTHTGALLLSGWGGGRSPLPASTEVNESHDLTPPLDSVQSASNKARTEILFSRTVSGDLEAEIRAHVL